MKIKNITRQATYWLGIIAVGLVIGLGIQSASAWTNPTATPPNSNVPGPLTTGDSGQTKTGNLILNTSGTYYYGLSANGYIQGLTGLCIGADCRTSWPGGMSGTGTTNYIPKWSNSTTLTNSVIYDDGTRIGIGTTAPSASAKLNVKGAIMTEDDGSGYARIYLSPTGNTTQTRLSSNGSVLYAIGGTFGVLDNSLNPAAAYALKFCRDTSCFGFNDSATSGLVHHDAVIFTQNSLYVKSEDGTTAKPVCASNVTCFSDERLKTDITPVTGALDKLLQIHGVNFDWKDVSNGTGLQLGVIAQDVEKVFPEAVFTNNDGYKGVKYESLVAPLIEAVREQQAEIDQLRQEINNLKANR